MDPDSESEPVETAVLDRLKQCSPAAIADTGHEQVTVLSPAIAPVHQHCTCAGTVRTVTLDPSALWAPVQTLDAAREDEVIVVDTGETIEEAIWGELLATYATRIGVRGLVTNGAVRDVAGIRELEFPVFAQSVTPRGPSGRTEAERNVEVTIGGAQIAPRDVLVGDQSGVVAIDRDAVSEVTAAAESIVETEQEVDRLISEGHSLEQAFDTAGMT